MSVRMCINMSTQWVCLCIFSVGIIVSSCVQGLTRTPNSRISVNKVPRFFFVLMGR